jgi:hypothetical protein
VAYATSYELGGRIAGDRIVVFKGRRADGIMVLLHQMTPGLDHTSVLKLAIAYMLRYPPASGGRILDLVELEGLTYLVTVDEPACLALPAWLSIEAGHALAPEALVTAEVPLAAGQAPVVGTAQPGFTPFIGSMQSTAGAVSPPQATRPPTRRELAPTDQKPVGAFTAFAEPVTLGGPAATTPEPLRSPTSAPPSPAQSSNASPSTTPAEPPAADQGIVLSSLGSYQTPATPAAPPTTYLIAQPKAGLSKTLLFTLAGFLVVAALFWLAMAVVRGMH